MASYMHIGDSNNIDRKVKSILLIGGGVIHIQQGIYIMETQKVKQNHHIEE